MKKSPGKTESGATNVPVWFIRLWNGTLFGGQKDKLILRILKLGGKDLLMSECGLALDKHTIDAASAPSMKSLLAVLRKAKSEKGKLERSAAKAESILAHADPDDYDIKRTVLSNTKDGYCETEFWIPKQSSAKRRKQNKR